MGTLTGEPREQFLEHFQRSLEDGSFVRLRLSQPAAQEKGVERINARLIEIDGRPHLSVTASGAGADRTENLPLSSAAAWLGAEVPVHFQAVWLGTTRRDWQLLLPAEGRARLIRHKPATTAAPARSHDQARHDILDASARDWLEALGIMDAQGVVRARMADKYRQINRYVELLSHLAAEAGWNADAAPRIADMGSGKGYLTFGVWHLFRSVHGWPARVLGVEARGDLVAATNGVARQINAEGLEFIEGTIDSVPLDQLDVLIALHACNTATDDALLRGLAAGARLIVVAPCCHQEIRPQLTRPEPLAPVMQHGLMEERLAEWLTDGLRALFLEWAGYRPRLIEFIGSEHTPKNLLLAAVRTGPPFADPAARARIVDLKRHFGIQRHRLDPLLEMTPGVLPEAATS